MGFIKSPNFGSRNNKNIDSVVLHTTVGTESGTIAWFKNPASQVSAHYVVSLDTNITQMVNEDKAAWHVGIAYKPTSKVYKGFNANFNTIGIECVDNKDPHNADRSKQYPMLINLVRDICTRHHIPIDKDHICGHREIRANKTCPGNIDVNYVIEQARQLGIDDNEKKLKLDEDIPSSFELTMKLKSYGEYDNHWTFKEMDSADRKKFEERNKDLRQENDLLLPELKVLRQENTELDRRRADMASRAIEAGKRADTHLRDLNVLKKRLKVLEDDFLECENKLVNYICKSTMRDGLRVFIEAFFKKRW